MVVSLNSRLESNKKEEESLIWSDPEGWRYATQRSTKGFGRFPMDEVPLYYLRDHRCNSTVVYEGIFDPKWAENAFPYP